MSDGSVPRNEHAPQGEPHTNSTTEPFDPYAAISDRELLALFVQTLRGCDFIYDIEAEIERGRKPELMILHDADYLALIEQWWILRDALESAAQRAARDARQAGEE